MTIPRGGSVAKIDNRKSQIVNMVGVADANATYYYHYDGRGSIVALSDANGDTVQTYEYSVFGEVAASDANHPNPYMFGGMRFEVETGLYYLGGPVYNPHIGRSLQQNFGIHWERYSWTTSNTASDAYALFKTKYTGWVFLDPEHPNALDGKLTWAYMDEGEVGEVVGFDTMDDWRHYVGDNFDQAWMEKQVGWDLANGNVDVFWDIQALIALGYQTGFKAMVALIEQKGVTIQVRYDVDDSKFVPEDNVILWRRGDTHWTSAYFKLVEDGVCKRGDIPGWNQFPTQVILAHEIAHAFDHYSGEPIQPGWAGTFATEQYALIWENIFRYAFYRKVPGYGWVDPRPVYGFSTRRDFIAYFGDDKLPHEESALHPDITWEEYFNPANGYPHVPWGVLN